MGLNVDLTHMLGAPEKVYCPRCKNSVDTYADDFDIECGSPNPEPGVWKLHCYCHTCSHDFYLVAEINPVWEIDGKGY